MQFDYRCEASNLNEVRANVAAFADCVVVPRAHTDLCTRRVLTMEYLKGVKLVTAIRGTFERLARLSGKTLAQIEAEAKNQPAQNQPALSAIQIEWLLRLTAWRQRAHWWAATAFNLLIGHWIGCELSVPEFTAADSQAAFNYRKVVETLIRVHAHTLMVDGVFNGDPHPGTFCVSDLLSSFFFFFCAHPL